MKILGVLAVLLLAGCAASSTPETSASPSTVAVDSTPAELLAGEDWVLVGGTGEPNAAPFGVTLRFDDGQLSGKGPVNRYSGPVTIGAGTLQPGALAATKMAGPEDAMSAEQAYLAALQKVTTWEVADESLTLADPAGPVLVYAAPDSAGAFAMSLVGQPVKKAKAAIAAAGYEARVVSVDGDVRPVTMDYRPDRINLTIVDGLVTNATVG